MPFQVFEAEVDQIINLTSNVVEINFKLLSPKQIDFKPGQFLMLNVPSDEGKIIKRAYSIASNPTDKEIVTFAVKLLPDGKASNYIRTFKQGDIVKLDGPLGHFFLQEDHQKEMLFVGTGTGLAPLHSMIVNNLQAGNSHKMQLFFGVRNEEDIFWQQKFEDLAAKYQNFTYTLTLSQPSDAWTGDQGRVTDHLRMLDLDDANNTQAYLCGSLPMVNEVTEILKEKGMAATDIKKEVY